MAGREHRYGLAVDWTGNTGAGTAHYRAYERRHDISAAGKPVIAGSSDPAFRGDPARWNPEELLVAALSACHKLWSRISQMGRLPADVSRHHRPADRVHEGAVHDGVYVRGAGSSSVKASNNDGHDEWRNVRHGADRLSSACRARARRGGTGQIHSKIVLSMRLIRATAADGVLPLTPPLQTCP